MEVHIIFKNNPTDKWVILKTIKTKQGVLNFFRTHGKPYKDWESVNRFNNWTYEGKSYLVNIDSKQGF